MPPEKIDVTIKLVVDTAKLFGYWFKNPNGPDPIIDSYCHFEQSGGSIDKGNGQNENFKTSVNLSEVKSIKWVGASSSEKGIGGTVNIHSIVSENHVNVFSSLICSGNPKNIVGTLENEIQSPTKVDKETYTIYFYVNFLPTDKPKMYHIDPKLEINT